MKMIMNMIRLKATYTLLSAVLLVLSCEAQNRIKKTDYEYDLISGNVKQVTYQANHPEVFVQQYKYDADNRITEVRSSTDGVIFNRDAAFNYYKHGPLARIVIGDNNIQGLDHTYTLHGWLKAVNSNLLDPSKDPGKDGEAGSKTARDVVGFSLGYYTNDYSSIAAGSMQFLSTITINDLDQNNSSLYNGSIRHMITSLTDNSGTQLDVQGSTYRYDQLDRIKQAELFLLNKLTNSFSVEGLSTKYKENFSYDANGNITGLTRNGNAATRLMDQLTYKYAEEGGKKSNNRLLHVKDDALTAAYSNDINDQGAYVSNDAATWNYRYDAIGNLISDRQSGIEEISWNVTGKIKSIHGLVDSARSDIEFKYDALGHRIAKIVKPFGHLTDPSFWISTYYVLDAKGNTLAVYEKKTQNGEEKILLKEQYVYSGKRLCNVQRDLDVTEPYLPMPRDTYTFERILGKKQYELSNHLGNVLAIISDKRTAHLNGAGIPDYFLAQVSSATDYYVFGSPMPGRDINSTNYRYGFNGMEKDNEVKGTGNSYDFGARMYDARLGRWLSLDKMANKAPDWSPYRFGFDNPIKYKDTDGNWEADGHFWTVYAMGVAMGMDNATAREIAKKAQYYDDHVHDDNKMETHIAHDLLVKTFSALLPATELGTWADPNFQQDAHGLTGGLHSDVLDDAVFRVLSGELEQLHKVGDAFSHSYINNKGVRMMYGNPNPVFITLEHRFFAGFAGEVADHIDLRSKEYKMYQNVLIKIFNDPDFKYNHKVRKRDPDTRIFDYIQKYSDKVEDNIFMFQSYIQLESGRKSFSASSRSQFDLLTGYLNEGNMKYTTTKTYENGLLVGGSIKLK